MGLSTPSSAFVRLLSAVLLAVVCAYVLDGCSSTDSAQHLTTTGLTTWSCNAVCSASGTTHSATYTTQQATQSQAIAACVAANTNATFCPTGTVSCTCSTPSALMPRPGTPVEP